MRLCRRYGVTRSGYYAWRRRPESAHAEQDRHLLARITRIFQAHEGRYGSPRVHLALAKAGVRVSRRRVARLMRGAGLRAKAVRGYRSKAGVHRFYDRQPNLVRGSSATRPNQVWVGDITYLPVAGRWWYLAVVMDQYSRRVLSWSLTPRRDARVTAAVLRAAARVRQARGGPRGVIFHSDRGSEYMAAPFGACVRALGLRQSASTRGPEDNAHMESFFHSLKAELTRGVHFRSARALRRQLRQYIRYYNRIRMHSALEYHSPIAFESRAA
jgi:transposase InsO family protein